MFFQGVLAVDESFYPFTRDTCMSDRVNTRMAALPATASVGLIELTLPSFTYQFCKVESEVESEVYQPSPPDGARSAVWLMDECARPQPESSPASLPPAEHCPSVYLDRTHITAACGPCQQSSICIYIY